MKLSPRFNTIRFKLSLLIGMLTVVYSAILISYFNYKYKYTLLNAAVEKSKVFARNYSVEIKSQIESALDISRTTAQIFTSQTNKEYPLELTRKDANLMLRNLVDKNTFLLGMYTAWEPDMFDGKDAEFAGKEGNHPDGHFVPYWYRDTETGRMEYEPLKYYLVEGKGDYYLKTRISKKETVVDPITYKIGNKQVMLMTLVAPVLDENGKFVGIVGTDISSEAIQKLLDNAHLFDDKGQLAIVSNNGTVVANSNQAKVGLNIKNVYPDIAPKLSALKGMESVIESDTLKTLVPISFGSSDTPWYVVVKVPISYLTEGLLLESMKLVLFGLAFLAILIFVTSYFIMKFLKPIRKITRVAQKVAVGNLDVWDVQSTSIEIGQLNEAFHKVIDSQKGITEVTEAIAQGDYTKRAEVKSEHDTLAKSVNLMIDNLKKSTEEDNKRKWMNEGYAQFAELLRAENDLQKLSQSALNYLIKYLNANQGGVFIVNETDYKTSIDLTAAYAYNRVKYVSKSISPGEGLVGQVYLERETTVLTEIPEKYLFVTSGLGEATPKCLILVPLINNEKVEGVLEMASFRKPEDYQVEFLEKCAVSLASVISSARISELTQKLLAEAQDQAEQMRMQEEEMRQNVEELAATQEEMRRRENEYLAKIEKLEKAQNKN